MKLYEEDMQYYPTPKALLDKICEGMDWRKIQTVLEPSAGKGDIAEYVKEAIRCHGYRYDAQIDCIEKDRQLRSLLEGKEFHVIHDDFLTEVLLIYDRSILCDLLGRMTKGFFKQQGLILKNADLGGGGARIDN